MLVGYVCVCFVTFFVFLTSFVCVCVCVCVCVYVSEYVTQCATHWINNAPRPVSILLCSNDIAFNPDT